MTSVEQSKTNLSADAGSKKWVADRRIDEIIRVSARKNISFLKNKSFILSLFLFNLTRNKDNAVMKLININGENKYKAPI